MEEHLEITLASAPSGEGKVWCSIVVEADGSVVVKYDGYWPPRPEDPWDGFSRWLRILPSEVARVHEALTGRLGAATSTELVELLVMTYRGRIEAYDEIAGLCDKYGIVRDRGTWMESA